MPKVPRSVLKSFFETGDRPSQSNFESLIDSMLHYSEDRSRFGLRSYDSTFTYAIGDTTIFAGSIYQCVMQTTGPFDPMRWQQMVALGSVVYVGAWNAATNSPTIQSGVGSKGHYYVVSANGATAVDGVNSWMVGDWIIYNGSTWEKVDNTDDVSAVDVTFSPSGDITSLNVQAAIVELAQDTAAALDGKVDKLPATAGGNLVEADGDGNLSDTGLSISDFLSKENTEPYTPLEIHNPATKKYVDDGDENKVNKLIPTVPGNVIALEADGELRDTGVHINTVITTANTAADIPFSNGAFLSTNVQNAIVELNNNTANNLQLKMDLASPSTAGHFASLSTLGNVVDSGLAQNDLLTKNNNSTYTPTGDYNPATKKYVDDATAAKANKTIPLEVGAIATLDSNGNLLDSGVTTADFLSASTSATQIPFTPNGNTTATNVQAAIVEVRNDLDSSKADKVGASIAGNLAGLNASGNLTDSGIAATNILAKDNNTSYTPTANFNPATKKYVDDADTRKTDKVITAIAGNLAGLNASGNLTDSGIAATNILAKDNNTSYTPTANFNPATKKYVDDVDVTKADKVLSATDGHFAALTASGNLRNGGYGPTDFLDKNNGIPYTPATDFNPATKKYVDDSDAGKADKIIPALSGNIAALNASGNLVDSGYTAADFLGGSSNASQVPFTPTPNVTSTDVQSAVDEVAQDLVSGLAGKANKVTGATLGNFAALNSSGNLTDSNFSPDDYLHKTNTEAFDPTAPFHPSTKKYVDDTTSPKADKVIPSAVGNIAVLSASGNLTDSGVTYTNFLTTSSTASNIPFTPNGDIVATNTQNAIVEVRNDTDTKLGAKMNLVAGAATGNIATLNASGQAIDSGLSPASFLTSTPPASGVAFTPNGDIAATNVQNAIVEVRNETDIKLSGKMDRVEVVINGNIAILNGSGQALDSGFRPSSFMASNANASTIPFTPNGDIAASNIQNAIVEVRDETDTKLASKMGLVAAATAGHFATLNASGQVIDSGLDPSSFLTSTPPASSVTFTPNGDIVATNVQNAIVEVRNDTDAKLSVKMGIVETAVIGNIPVFIANGQTQDSGLRPSNFMSASANASNIPFTPNGDIASTNTQAAVVELRDDTDIKLALLRRQTMAFTFAANIVFPSATVTLTFVRMGSQMLIPAASSSFLGTNSITAVMVMIYSTTVNNLTGEAGLMDITTSSTVAAINGSTVAMPATASTNTFTTIVSPEFTLPAGAKVYSPLYRKTVALTGSFNVQSVALILKYNL